jgi:hypothetical protein
MGLKSDKDHVRENAIAAQKAQPPQRKTTSTLQSTRAAAASAGLAALIPCPCCSGAVLDVTAKGATARVDPEKSGLAPTYTKKKEYGQTPAYLEKRRQASSAALAYPYPPRSFLSPGLFSWFLFGPVW